MKTAGHTEAQVETLITYLRDMVREWEYPNLRTLLADGSLAYDGVREICDALRIHYSDALFAAAIFEALAEDDDAL